VCLAGRGASPPECCCRAGLKSVLAHFRCNRQAPAQVKPYALRHLPDRDGQVHDALFLGLLEQSQDPCYLTDGMFCSVFPAPNVRKNRFRLEIENDVGIGPGYEFLKGKLLIAVSEGGFVGARLQDSHQLIAHDGHGCLRIRCEVVEEQMRAWNGYEQTFRKALTTISSTVSFASVSTIHIMFSRNVVGRS
jgi:hypothetical protein